MIASPFVPRTRAGRALPFSLTILTAALCLADQAQAQQATDESLTPVVVSASRFPNDPAFAPVATTVITADQIRAAGIADANEAIRKLGGVYGRQSSASPSDFPLDMRGFGTNGDQNMVVLLDGVRISENELSTPLLSSIPVESIERIEIVRGGSSVLYGSGATGGTIQIITKRARRNAGYGSVTAELGSAGQRAGRAFVAQGWDNMAIDASYAKSHTDGYRDNTQANQQNFSTTLQWFGSDWRFGLRTTISRADYGLAGGLTQAQFDANPRQAATPNNYGAYDTNSITAFLERSFGSIDLAAELSHREKDMRTMYSGSPYEYNVRGTQFSPRLRQVVRSGALKNEWIAGVDLAEWASHVATYTSDAAQHSKALYLRDELEWAGNARLAAGVRRELFNQSSVANGYARNTGVNAWDVQGSYAPWQVLRVFAKAGQSYRLATPDENGYTALTSGQVFKPQVSHDLELGATLGSGDRQLTARWFRHRVRDELYYDPTLNFGYGANTNLDPTRHQGVEVEGRLAVRQDIVLSTTYQYVVAKFTEGTYAGNQSADAGVRWAASQRAGGDFANTCARMPSYATFDARYALRVQSWEFALAGTNLGNRHYYSQAYSCTGTSISSIYPEDGRAVKLTARYDF